MAESEKLSAEDFNKIYFKMADVHREVTRLKNPEMSLQASFEYAVRSVKELEATASKIGFENQEMQRFLSNFYRYTDIPGLDPEKCYASFFGKFHEFNSLEEYISIAKQEIIECANGDPPELSYPEGCKDKDQLQKWCRDHLS